jgi:hypothetical protein
LQPKRDDASFSLKSVIERVDARAALEEVGTRIKNDV